LNTVAILSSAAAVGGSLAAAAGRVAGRPVCAVQPAVRVARPAGAAPGQPVPRPECRETLSGSPLATSRHARRAN
jgi:hypothetical protein